MAKPQEPAQANAQDIARVWEIVEQVGVGMLTTRFAGGLRARPVEPRLDRAANLIRVVTDVRGLKDDEIVRSPDVALVVIDAKDKAYLSITGRAEVTRDANLARRIWLKTDDVWWPDGPDDPNVRVIEIAPSLAELWDGPSSSMVAAYEMTKARLTGEKPDLGENRKKTVRLG
jgi:general stress protein 26